MIVGVADHCFENAWRAGAAVLQDHAMEDVLKRVLPRIGGIEAVERLAALSGSDFTSVMLEVAPRTRRNGC